MCMYCRREACRDDLLRGRTRCPGGQGAREDNGWKGSPAAGGRHRATLIDHAPPWHRGRMISRPLDGIGGLWGIPVHHQGTRTSHQTPSPPKQGTNGWTGGGGGGGGRGRPVSSPLVRAAVGQSNVHVPFLLCSVFQLFLLPRTSTLPFDSAAVDVLLLLFVARGNLIPILALLPFSPI